MAKIKLNLPKSWADVTIKQYCIIKEIEADDNLDRINKDIDTICLLTGITYQQALALTMKRKHDALKSLAFLNSFDSIPKKINNYFFCKGKLYRLELNMANITWGQYTDLMTFLKDPEKSVDNIHNIFAVLAQPLKFGIWKREYDGEKHSELAKVFFENLTIAQTYPILVFFCSLSDNLITNLLGYLKEKTEMMKASLMTKQATSQIMAG